MLTEDPLIKKVADNYSVELIAKYMRHWDADVLISRHEFPPYQNDTKLHKAVFLQRMMKLMGAFVLIKNFVIFRFAR